MLQFGHTAYLNIGADTYGTNSRSWFSWVEYETLGDLTEL